MPLIEDDTIESEIEESSLDKAEDAEVRTFKKLIEENREARLEIWKYTDPNLPLEKNKAYVTTVPAGDFSDWPDVYEYVRGLFRDELPVRVLVLFRAPNGKVKLKAKPLVDEDPARRKEKVDAEKKQAHLQLPGMDSAVTGQMASIAEQHLAMVKDLVTTVRAPAPTDQHANKLLEVMMTGLFGLMSAQMQALASMNRSTGPSDPTEQIDRIFGLAEKMAKRISGEPDEEEKPPLVRIVETVAPVLGQFAEAYKAQVSRLPLSAQTPMIRPQVLKQAQAQSNPKRPRQFHGDTSMFQKNLIVAKLRQYREQFQQIHALAGREDPKAVAEAIYDNLPEDVYADDVLSALQHPLVETFFEVYPEALQHRAWYDQIRDAMIEMAKSDIEEPEEDGGDGAEGADDSQGAGEDEGGQQ
jgi:hypothetical protein